MPLPFISGFPPASTRFLARFLPPLPEGVAAHYIETYTHPGDLILDPFGQAPSVAVEALHLGRRIIVSNFNPVSRLALSFAVRPPAERDLLTVLTQLADARIHTGERLETYVRGLYATTCAACGKPTSADTITWEGGEPAILTYHCAHCRTLQNTPATEADRAQAKRFTPRSLDYFWLLEHAAALDDPDRDVVEETLAMYPPRALSALATVLRKFDGLDLEREPRRLLAGLLIAAFDAACPFGQERPKTLTHIPKHYIETNIFLALEQAVRMLAGPIAPDRVATLAEVLRQPLPAIYVHPGAARDLAAQLPPQSVHLLLSAFPRPNQAYWSLSALWAAWLWGHEAASTVRGVLRRRRFDWDWHTEAVYRALGGLTPTLAPTGRFVGFIPEAEPGFNTCVFTAVNRAGYALEDAVFRADTAEAQGVWRVGRLAPEVTAETMRATFAFAARQVFQHRAEPVRWPLLHFALWASLAERYALTPPWSFLNRWVDEAAQALPSAARLAAQPADELTVGQWFMAEAAEGQAPLADRVELSVARCLASGEPRHEQDIFQAVYAELPGELTPGYNVVFACLNSYAQRLNDHYWRLRAEDSVLQRTQEQQALLAGLSALAVQYGFIPSADNPQVWRDNDHPVYAFAVSASAEIGRYVLGDLPAAHRRLWVVPGGRASLLDFKLRRDPHLRSAFINSHWQIVKYRQLRQILSTPQLSRAAFDPALIADPLAETQQLLLMP